MADVNSQRIYQWLSPQDPSDNHSRALLQCHKGTGQWFIQGEIFTSFISLPPNLDITYARIIDRIPTRYREHSIRILQVLTWSERPLTIDEAVDFLAVKPVSERGFDVANRMPVPKEITRLCSGLVTIADSSSPRPRRIFEPPRRISKTQEIRLSHFSVKEYLKSDRLDMNIGSSLCQTTAAEHIASVLLAYLLALGFCVSSFDRVGFPLLEYSGQYWTSFAWLAGNGSQTLRKLTLELFQTKHASHVICVVAGRIV